jgi:hypothetical protein
MKPSSARNEQPRGASPKGRSVYPQAVRIPSDYPWVVLDGVLSALAYDLPDSFCEEVRAIIRSRDFSEYLNLSKTYGLQSINHRADEPPLYEIAGIHLVCSLIRKYSEVGYTSPKQRRDECLSRVIELDKNLSFVPGVLQSEVASGARSIIKRMLGARPDLHAMGISCRHGPGSSTVHSYDRRSAYFKYAEWPYRCTPRAAPIMRDVICADPRWVGALEHAYRRRYRISAWSILDQEVFWNNVVVSDSPCNRITSVPKDSTKDRPIAIEPPGNVFLQLGIDGLFRDALRYAGNPIDDQVRNRLLCVEASKTGRLATIDLSDASDTIHLDVVKSLLPPAWFELLCSVRSPFGELPDGTAWRYAKMSSMGNATTFVLETIVFYAICRACCREFAPRRHNTVAVFGDDIIAPTYVASQINIYLQLFGFKPNLEKCFLKGPVRESCGVDCYNGSDIRPIFLKKKPRTDLDLYSDRNRLNSWWVKHMGNRLPAELDQIFFKWLRLEPMFGPPDTNDYRSYLHDEDFRSPYFEAYAERSVDLPAREFDFRKLMHTLQHPSEGGKFRVTRDSRKLMIVRRVSRDAL